jgi:hypothetical protein
MASYYRRFIRDFAKIATPLHRLTEGTPKKSDKVDWSPQCEEAFQELKAKLGSAPVLQMYDANKPIVIETDASDFTIGAVLQQPSQEDPKVMRPVAFFSQNLKEPPRTMLQTKENSWPSLPPYKNGVAT